MVDLAVTSDGAVTSNVTVAKDDGDDENFRPPSFRRVIRSEKQSNEVLRITDCKTDTEVAIIDSAVQKDECALPAARSTPRFRRATKAPHEVEEKMPSVGDASTASCEEPQTAEADSLLADQIDYDTELPVVDIDDSLDVDGAMPRSWRTPITLLIQEGVTPIALQMPTPPSLPLLPSKEDSSIGSGHSIQPRAANHWSDELSATYWSISTKHLIEPAPLSMFDAAKPDSEDISSQADSHTVGPAMPSNTDATMAHQIDIDVTTTHKLSQIRDINADADAHELDLVQALLIELSQAPNIDTIAKELVQTADTGANMDDTIQVPDTDDAMDELLHVPDTDDAMDEFVLLPDPDGAMHEFVLVPDTNATHELGHISAPNDATHELVQLPDTDDNTIYNVVQVPRTDAVAEDLIHVPATNTTTDDVAHLPGATTDVQDLDHGLGTDIALELIQLPDDDDTHELVQPPNTDTTYELVQVPDTSNTAGESVPLPDSADTAEAPVQLTDTNDTTHALVPLTDTDGITDAPVQLTDNDDTTDAPVQLTDTDDTTDAPVQLTDTDDTTHTLVKVPDTNDTTHALVQLPDTDDTTHSLVKVPDGDDTTHAPVQLTDTDHTTHSLVKVPDSDDATHPLVQLTDTDDTTHALVQLPDTDDATHAPVQVPDTDDTTHATVQPTDTDDTTHATVQIPDTDDTTHALVQVPDTDDATHAPVQLPNTDDTTHALVQVPDTDDTTHAPVQPTDTDDTTRAPVQIPNTDDTSGGGQHLQASACLLPSETARGASGFTTLHDVALNEHTNLNEVNSTPPGVETYSLPLELDYEFELATETDTTEAQPHAASEPLKQADRDWGEPNSADKLPSLNSTHNSSTRSASTQHTTNALPTPSIGKSVMLDAPHTSASVFVTNYRADVSRKRPVDELPGQVHKHSSNQSAADSALQRMNSNTKEHQNQLPSATSAPKKKTDTRPRVAISSRSSEADLVELQQREAKEMSKTTESGSLMSKDLAIYAAETLLDSNLLAFEDQDILRVALWPAVISFRNREARRLASALTKSDVKVNERIARAYKRLDTLSSESDLPFWLEFTIEIVNEIARTKRFTSASLVLYRDNITGEYDLNITKQDGARIIPARKETPRDQIMLAALQMVVDATGSPMGAGQYRTFSDSFARLKPWRIAHQR